MAPKGLDTPEACMIAIMHGLEVGLSPLSALQRIAVINGRPTLWGDGALALVKASGLCEAIEEWIEGDDDDPSSWMAICNLIRKHDPVPVERRFSTADAKRAKLWGKSGPWSDYPKRMLQMRARAFALRDAFPDVLGGLYLTEEFLGEAESLEQAPASDPSAVRLSAASSATSSGMSCPTSSSKSEATLSATASLNASTASAPLSARSSATSAVTIRPDQNEPGLNGHEDGQRSAQYPAAFKGNIAINTDPRSSDEDHEVREDQEPHQPHQPHTGEQTYAQLPPLANLRRTRSMPREVRALRFRNQWSIRQPRGPRAQHNGASVDHRANQTTTSPHDDRLSPNQENLIQKNVPCQVEREQQPNSSPLQNHFIPPDDVAAHLDLYDAALCCAQDEETLAEIAEEFTERLTRLPRQSRNDAEIIFERHQVRIKAVLNDRAQQAVNIPISAHQHMYHRDLGEQPLTTSVTSQSNSVTTDAGAEDVNKAPLPIRSPHMR
jgi:hypothetical protein